jgi:hypothetical protein
MAKHSVLKYRWIVLFALPVWGLLAISIAFGMTRRKEFTFVHTFIPLAMLLIALAPVSVPRIATHRWFLPIAATWSCSAIVAIHFLGAWLTGLGHQCDWVVLTASIAGFCVLNIGWLATRLWRRYRTAETSLADPESAGAVGTAG